MPTPNGDNQSLTPAERRLLGSKGGYTSWSNTPDRRARMSVPQRQSPIHLAWHLRKLGLDPNNPSEEDIKRAESSRRAYRVELTRKAVATRKRHKAERLRRMADELEAQADGTESAAGELT